MDSPQVIRQALLDQLEDHGWGRIAVATHAFPGDPSEEWTLESLWEPRGLQAQLSLTLPAGANGRLHVTVTRQPVSRAWDEGRFSGWVLASRRRQVLAQVFIALTDWRDWNARQQLLDAATQAEQSEWQEASPQALFQPAGPAGGPTVEEMAWLSCPDPRRLLEQAKTRLSERKLRLLACAACRSHWPLMQNARNVLAVEAMELYADGLIAKRELKTARKAASISWLTSYEPYQEALQTLAVLHRGTPAGQESSLRELVCEVAGNPFRPVTPKYSWLRWNNSTPVAMAQAIYAERRFDEMPILADALEEAGCTSAAMLGHCRSDRNHVRGCWVLDALLGKT